MLFCFWIDINRMDHFHVHAPTQFAIVEPDVRNSISVLKVNEDQNKEQWGESAQRKPSLRLYVIMLFCQEKRKERGPNRRLFLSKSITIALSLKTDLIYFNLFINKFHNVKQKLLNHWLIIFNCGGAVLETSFSPPSPPAPLPPL